MESKLTITLALLLVTCIGAHLAIALSFNSDENEDIEKSPIINAIGLLLMEFMLNTMMSWKLDFEAYMQMVMLNKTRALEVVAKLYPSQQFIMACVQNLYIGFYMHRLLLDYFLMDMDTPITSMIAATLNKE